MLTKAKKSSCSTYLEEDEYDINIYDCRYFVFWLNCQSCYVMWLQQHTSYVGIVWGLKSSWWCGGTALNYLMSLSWKSWHDTFAFQNLKKKQYVSKHFSNSLIFHTSTNQEVQKIQGVKLFKKPLFLSKACPDTVLSLQIRHQYFNLKYQLIPISIGHQNDTDDTYFYHLFCSVECCCEAASSDIAHTENKSQQQ